MKFQLVSAELSADGYAEDIFRISPENTQDQSVEISVTHLHRSRHGTMEPVIMLHGQFSNRSLWYRKERDCLALEMLDQNFEVWIPEMRGHGMSPVNRAYRRNSLQDYADFDLPSIQSFVDSRSGSRPAIWITYGLGALAVVAALQSGRLDQHMMSGLVVIALDSPRGAWKRASLSLWSRLAAKRTGIVHLKGGHDVHSEPEPLTVLTTTLDYHLKSASQVIDLAALSLLVIDLVEPHEVEPAMGDKLLAAWPGNKKKKVIVRCNSINHSLDTAESYKLIRGSLMLWLKGQFIEAVNVPVGSGI